MHVLLRASRSASVGCGGSEEAAVGAEACGTLLFAYLLWPSVSETWLPGVIGMEFEDDITAHKIFSHLATSTWEAHCTCTA